MMKKMDQQKDIYAEDMFFIDIDLNYVVVPQKYVN